MIALRNNAKLDNMLTKIFSNEQTMIVGCGFTADFAQFSK
jgi:hypothetical protein